jgi:hypothetical protein
MIKANGWQNHEDTFEETLRRELLAAKEVIHLLQEDLKNLTNAYYTVLKQNDEIKRKH